MFAVDYLPKNSILSMIRSILLIFLLFAANAVFAQMQFQGQALYGNEWIRSNQTYLKFKITEDGVYKISYQDLHQAGFPLGAVEINRLHLICLAQDVKLIRSTEGLMGTDDYLLFYGKKNRAELDAPLFADPTVLMNPEYSMHNDTASYYLTWDHTINSNVVEKLKMIYQHLCQKICII